MQSKGNAPTAQQVRLRELFDYDHLSGVFTRKIRMGHCAKGTHATGTIERGYQRICVDGKQRYAHRLAWIYAHGYEPEQIDHINHIRDDNRLANLRSVSHLENHRNHKLKSNNSSGITGVWWNKKNGNWCAEIKVNRKKINLGSFDKKSDAAEARKLAEDRYGFHENHGVSCEK